MDSMYAALNAVKSLRLEVGNLFTTISEGVKEEHGEDGREFINEIQRMINAAQHRYRELEQAVASISNAAGNLNLQTSAYLTQENNLERHSMYAPLVRSHKWIEKVHKYSTIAHYILNSNSLKKSFILNPTLNKRKRPLISSFFIGTPNWDVYISNFMRIFPEMNFAQRTYATNFVLQITLGRVFHAMIAFKGCMIEWVVIKGYNESCSLPADLMSESRYQVFRRITDHAHAATLHFALPNMSDMIRPYLFWIYSYLNLFSATCKQCGKHSYDCYPPTWRDFKTNEPYHFECKP